MRPGEFLCGCDANDPRLRRYRMSVRSTPYGEEMSWQRFDQNGNEVCPVHGYPLYGYLSPQKGKLIDWSKMGSGTDVKLHESTMPDKRPHTLDALLDERALLAIARASGNPKNGQTDAIQR